MFKRLIVGTAVAVALAGTGAATAHASPAAGAVAHPTELARAATVPVQVQTPAAASAARLSAAELGAVEGAGIWTKIKRFFRKLIKIITNPMPIPCQTTCNPLPEVLFDREEVHTFSSSHDGGEILEVIDDHYTYFETEWHLDNGISSGSSVSYGSWTQTSTWGGGGGGGGIEPFQLEMHAY